ncbi:MAG: hypothetical protein JWN79_3296, partial [Gemmatimonadetes bacterium]|nr:hypothetical protein [Gemmatimonadota bacterium]
DAALAADVYAAERAALKRSLVETLQRERGAA